MLPAHQSLDAVDDSGAHVDLRLAVQDELVLLERGPQFLHGAQALVALGVVARVVDAVASRAADGSRRPFVANAHWVIRSCFHRRQQFGRLQK